MRPATTTARRQSRDPPTAEARLHSLVDVALENFERAHGERRRTRTLLVDAEVLPERDAFFPPRLELGHHDVRTRREVVFPEVLTTDLHRGLARTAENRVGVAEAAKGAGLVLVCKLVAADLEAALDGQGGVVVVEEGNFEDIFVEDVAGKEVLHEQVERKSGVDEGGVVKRDPGGKV